MGRILMVYETKQKQTEKIAFFISSQLQHQRHEVAIYDLKSIPAKLDLQNYDGLIIGAPVRMRKFSPALRQWARNNGPYFYNKSTAFFSVCLGILDKNPETRKDEEKIVQDFFKSVHWKPDVWKIFAGALVYSKYNFFLKLMMWAIALRSGSRTKITEDYEYTDWDQVNEFIEEFTRDFRVEEECERMIFPN